MCSMYFYVFLQYCFKDAASQEKTINLIHMLRDYLHYHIKCSKVKLLLYIPLFVLEIPLCYGLLHVHVSGRIIINYTMCVMTIITC